MSVYVDDMRADFSRMKMCHMVADTSKELHAMAKKIGVKRKWVQDEGTYSEHYDICLSKRRLAVLHGAKEISWMDFGRFVYARKPLESGIYMIRHRDGRVYIGSAENFGRRQRQHVFALNAGSHGNVKLQTAWFEDGPKAFKWRILKRCTTDKLMKAEQRFIEKYDSVNSGFNIAPEAGKVTFGKAYRMRSKGRKPTSKRSH